MVSKSLSAHNLIGLFFCASIGLILFSGVIECSGSEVMMMEGPLGFLPPKPERPERFENREQLKEYVVSFGLFKKKFFFLFFKKFFSYLNRNS